MANNFNQDELAFISRVENRKIINLLLYPQDFKAENREALRYCFEQHILSTRLPSISSVTANSLNAAINSIKGDSRFDYVMKPTGVKQIGPGEVLLYLLVEGSELVGQGDDRDLRVNGRGYEIKGVKIGSFLGSEGSGVFPPNSRCYVDFFFSGKFATSKYVQDILKLANENGIESTARSKGEFNKTLMNRLRTAAPEEMAEIENEYGRAASQYTDSMIFIGNTPGREFGNVFEVGRIPASRIRIERITQDRAKPAILLR